MIDVIKPITNNLESWEASNSSITANLVSRVGKKIKVVDNSNSTQYIDEDTSIDEDGKLWLDWKCLHDVTEYCDYSVAGDPQETEELEACSTCGAFLELTDQDEDGNVWEWRTA